MGLPSAAGVAVETRDVRAEEIVVLSLAMFSFLSTHRPVAIAHRGGFDDAPENSMAAFASAIELGYRVLETDVHLARDGAVVAAHDVDLDRISDERGPLSDRTATELASVRLLDTDGQPSDQGIPTLDELLSSWPDAYFNIDAKSDEVAQPLAQVIEDHGATDRVCLASFSTRRLRRLRKRLGPDLCTSMGREESTAIWLQSRLGRSLLPSGAPVVQLPITHRVRGRDVRLLEPSFIDYVHDRGLLIHAWTINTRDEMVGLLDMGIDGIITDRPALLRQVLSERDAWQ